MRSQPDCTEDADRHQARQVAMRRGQAFVHARDGWCERTARDARQSAGRAVGRRSLTAQVAGTPRGCSGVPPADHADYVVLRKRRRPFAVRSAFRAPLTGGQLCRAPPAGICRAVLAARCQVRLGQLASTRRSCRPRRSRAHLWNCRARAPDRQGRQHGDPREEREGDDSSAARRRYRRRSAADDLRPRPGRRARDCDRHAPACCAASLSTRMRPSSE